MPEPDRPRPRRSRSERPRGRPNAEKRVGARQVLRRTEWLAHALVWWTGAAPEAEVPADDLAVRPLVEIVAGLLSGAAPGLYAVPPVVRAEELPVRHLDAATARARVNRGLVSCERVESARVTDTLSALAAARHYPRELPKRVGDLEAWHERQSARVEVIATARRGLEGRGPEGLEALAAEEVCLWLGPPAGRPSRQVPTARLRTWLEAVPEGVVPGARLGAVVLGQRGGSVQDRPELASWVRLGAQLTRWPPELLTLTGSAAGGSPPAVLLERACAALDSVLAARAVAEYGLLGGRDVAGFLGGLEALVEAAGDWDREQAGSRGSPYPDPAGPGNFSRDAAAFVLLAARLCALGEARRLAAACVRLCRAGGARVGARCLETLPAFAGWQAGPLAQVLETLTGGDRGLLRWAQDGVAFPPGSREHHAAVRQLDTALELLGRNVDLPADLQATLLRHAWLDLESLPLWSRGRAARRAFVTWLASLASDPGAYFVSLAAAVFCLRDLTVATRLLRRVSESLGGLEPQTGPAALWLDALLGWVHYPPPDSELRMDFLGRHFWVVERILGHAGGCTQLGDWAPNGVAEGRRGCIVVLDLAYLWEHHNGGLPGTLADALLQRCAAAEGRERAGVSRSVRPWAPASAEERDLAVRLADGSPERLLAVLPHVALGAPFTGQPAGGWIFLTREPPCGPSCSRPWNGPTRWRASVAWSGGSAGAPSADSPPPRGRAGALDGRGGRPGPRLRRGSGADGG